MSYRIKTDVIKLFEIWCEIAPADDHSVCNGVIVAKYPETFGGTTAERKTLADIPIFAFPCEMESQTIKPYSFLLTNDDSKWSFGFCRYDSSSKTAMVLLTHLPWHDTFLKLLRVLGDLKRSSISDFEAFLSEVYTSGVPDFGRKLKIAYNGYDAKNEFIFERPAQFQLPNILENLNLSIYYSFIEPKNMIAVFAAMLAERRIIFTSKHLDRMSSCIQAAQAFLYPMVWQHIFVPLLPLKLKDNLCAPMPFLIGVPESVLNTMTQEEYGDVIIMNCDSGICVNPFDDVHEMPSEIISQLKKQLSRPSELTGDRISKIFLGVLVQLIGGYRDAVEFRDTGKRFNRDKFIESRPSHLRPFLTKMMELQMFQQFIDERLEMLNSGLGLSDEFEMETARYAEKMRRKGNLAFFKNVKDKTNPAVKSAVKSVKESSRGMKTAYKDLKSKLRDITPPNGQFRTHVPSNSQHEHIVDGCITGNNFSFGSKSSKHHSAPSSPVFSSKLQNNNNQKNSAARSKQQPFQYAKPEIINGTVQSFRRVPNPLAMSNSTSHIQSNGHTQTSYINNHLNNPFTSSPTVSPAGSLCSSEMNLSQELQNHPLFKTPIVDRSLKPIHCLEAKSRVSRSTATSGSQHPPARPPPPIGYKLSQQQISSMTTSAQKPSYYNHPYATQMQKQLSQNGIENLNVVTKPPPRPIQKSPSTPNGFMPNECNKKLGMITSTPTKYAINTTESSYDCPPDVPSPPIPPRRQMNGPTNGLSNDNSNTSIAAMAAQVSAGVQRLEKNCWEDYPERNLINSDNLRSSSSSNTSTISSNSSSAAALSSSSFSCDSSADSYRTAASTFSHAQLSQNSANQDVSPNQTKIKQQQKTNIPPVPVPAPRFRKDKESLRSLQPHYLQVTSTNSHKTSTMGSLNSVPSSSSQEEDNTNDLISLDDSHNNSFDIEDFDPLNQNARPLPQIGGNKKSTTLPNGTSFMRSQQQTSALMLGKPFGAGTNPVGPSSISNPLYPFFQPPNCQPPPLPKTKPPPLPITDDDFELLRKYDLHQFALTTSVTNTTTSAAVATASGMSNWTTFD